MSKAVAANIQSGGTRQFGVKKHVCVFLKDEDPPSHGQKFAHRHRMSELAATHSLALCAGES